MLNKRFKQHNPGDIIRGLTFLYDTSLIKPRRAMFRCYCGKEFECQVRNVIRETRSCGCARRKGEQLRINTPLWYLYQSMKSRCNNPKHESYKDYGARGIKVCDRWQKSFDRFSEDVGIRPSKNHTLDRINNDGDYEPGNCKWSTQTEQTRNTRASVFLEHNGSRYTLVEWSERLGIEYRKFHAMVRYRNMTLAEIISYQLDTHRPTNLPKMKTLALS